MRKVFLITGFNNWGKTHIIGGAFAKPKPIFRRDKLHRFPGSACDFMVQPYSNDDLRLLGYCEQYYERLNILRDSNLSPQYVVSAFCPTKEKEWRTKNGPKNKTSIDIIQELYGEDEVHMLLLLHKWCDHAELHPKDIAGYYSGLPNVTVTTITPSTYGPRLAGLSAAIHAQLP